MNLPTTLSIASCLLWMMTHLDGKEPCETYSRTSKPAKDAMATAIPSPLPIYTPLHKNDCAIQISVAVVVSNLNVKNRASCRHTADLRVVPSTSSYLETNFFTGAGPSIACGVGGADEGGHDGGGSPR